MRLTYTNGTVVEVEDLNPTIADLAAWELYALKRGLPTQLEEAQRLVQATLIMFLIHRALDRNGDTAAFDEWRESIVEADLDGEVEAGSVPPTRAVPSAA